MSEQKHILITGTSSGFGLDTAKALAAKGHRVSATMRGVNGKNEGVANELRVWAGEHGHNLNVIELDVADQTSVDAAVAEASKAAPIDTVINNAGIGVWGIDEGYSLEQAQAVFNVNLFGAMRVTRAVLPAMRKAGHGHLIYISSGLGRIALPFLAIYNASKFALEGYVETINMELAPEGISTQILQPGAFGTTFAAKTLQPADDKIDAYGPSAEIFRAFSAGFEEAHANGQLGDPQMVVDALCEEVERPRAERALRRAVGHDIAGPVGAINAAALEQSRVMLQAFGLGG